MKARVSYSGKTSAPGVSAWWYDHIFVTTVVVAALIWLSALSLSVVQRPFLLHKLAIPLAVLLYHPDQVPTPAGVQRFLSILAEAMGLMGVVMLAYACLWRYLLRRLPRSAPSVQVSTNASVSTLEGCSLAV